MTHDIDPSRLDRALAEGLAALRQQGGERSWDTERELERALHAIQVRPSHVSVPRVVGGSHVHRTLGRSLTGAACALILGIVGFTMWWHQAPQRAVASSSMRYTSAIGQRVTITLASGHRITLAPQSTILVNGATLALTGEAFFHIAPHSAIPLVVRAGLVTVHVLGTTFDVRHYANERIVQVAVQSGRVAVGHQSSRKTVVLHAGRVIQIMETGAVDTTADTTRANAIMAWTQGALVFDRTPLRDVTMQLSRWYGVPFVIRDSVLNRIPLTMTFRTTDAVDAIIHAIEVTTGTRVQREGNVMVITRTTRSVTIPELSPTHELARAGEPPIH